MKWVSHSLLRLCSMSAGFVNMLPLLSPVSVILKPFVVDFEMIGLIDFQKVLGSNLRSRLSRSRNFCQFTPWILIASSLIRSMVILLLLFKFLMMIGLFKLNSISLWISLRTFSSRLNLVDVDRLVEYLNLDLGIASFFAIWTDSVRYWI